MTTYSSNKEADQYTTSREPFKGSNTWGEWLTENLYAVFSYGRHFPIYAWDEELGVWFGNQDKYSRSTTRHQSQLRPRTDRIEYIDTQNIKNLLSAGSVKDWTIAKAQR
jgi:hypothetical protein